MLAKSVSAAFGQHKTQSWVTGLVTKEGKRQDLRLRDLDDVADAMKIHPGELVSRFGSRVYELRENEHRLIDAIRKLPSAMQPSFLDHLYFLMEGHLRTMDHDSRRREDMTAIARQQEQEGVRTEKSGTFRRKQAR